MKADSFCTCFKSNYVWNFPDEKSTNGKVLQENGNCWLQFAAVISVSVMSMGTGASEMWTSSALPHLRDENFKFKVTSNQLFWIASLYNVGEIIGFIFHPLLLNRMGRKNTLLVSALPQILASGLLLTAENVPTLYVARITGGIGSGSGIIVQNFYVNEIADKNIRGLLSSIPGFGIFFGMISILIVGNFFSYNSMNFSMLLFPLIFIGTFVFMTESPYSHLKYDQDEKAVECMSKLRGIRDSEILDLEINRIKEAIKQEEKCKKFPLRSLFENKRHRRAFIILSILKVAIAFSGVNVTTAYYQDFFNYVGFSLHPRHILLIVTSIVVVSIIPTFALIDYLGRRLMILYSSLACSSSLLIIGFFLFWKDHINSNDFSSFSWIPLIALVVSNVGCLVLIGTAGVLSGELFSIQIKSTALPLLLGKSLALNFIMDWSLENITDSIGIFGVFWIYSVICLLLSLFCFCIMPETKGKSLEEVQLLLD